MSTYVNNVKDTAQTQENLNPQNSVFPILVRTNETLLIEEGPTIVKKELITASGSAAGFVLDSGISGVLNEDILGEISGTEFIEQISNPRDIFIERFGYTTLQGTSNSATWDTANKQVTFTAGQRLEIVSAFKDSTATVTQSTLFTTIDSGSFDLELSANGGTDWETVTNETQHTFTNTGNDLRIRITENNSSTGTISLIRCTYVK